ncbi:endoplasmic oxidoreductin [Sistotremastrum suecicum HHB10207 ss-3]|uniref:Endoplasmic oxidoreductin n=1 Tax=Sistotremastrum suecicum HHB10207 ss-3 TaxID=1314776 RepID=A0A166ICE1_9AGAM|nr:endoplasmic oxidoreductin [Sistotremastrum suecicum HHB10207 ss-3]
MFRLHFLPPFLLAIIVAALNRQLASKPPSFLHDALVTKDPVQNVLEHQTVDAHQNITCHQPTGPIETTMCDYESLEKVNGDLASTLDDLVKTPFFKYFRVQLYRDCPFWQENGQCGNRGCGVTSVDESEIPEKWRAAALSKVERTPGMKHDLPGCYYRDSDFCFFDDFTEGEYIDLTANPEQFTGYSGGSAWRVWSTIYEENCFGISELSLLKSPSPAEVSLPDTMTAAFDNTPDSGPQCLEKRVYYKIISGMHASISTHICYDNLNQSTGVWGPDLDCFINRIAMHPERLQYIYFNTVLLLRAVSRLGPYLTAYDYCTGDHSEDEASRQMVQNVVDIASSVGKFDESVLFRGENANVLKEEFKTHFRNVTRIMDCVDCHKCRLWGKVQTTGIAAALKVLFELDDKTLSPTSNPNLLQRTEVVALMNTLHRFSESLRAVDHFRKMWSERVRNSQATEWPEENVESTSSNSTDGSSTALGGHLSFLSKYWDICQAQTSMCLSLCLGLLKSISDTFSSLFTLSGKDAPPREEF